MNNELKALSSHDNVNLCVSLASKASINAITEKRWIAALLTESTVFVVVTGDASGVSTSKTNGDPAKQPQ